MWLKSDLCIYTPVIVLRVANHATSSTLNKSKHIKGLLSTILFKYFDPVVFMTVCLNFNLWYDLLCQPKTST